MTDKRKSMRARSAAQQQSRGKARAQGTARDRRRQASQSDDFSVLARAKFDGVSAQPGQSPLRIALERPPVLRGVDLSWFYATVERLISYDDQQFCAVDPDDEAAQALLEFGTTCVHVAEWHRDVAKVYDALVARIAVRAARKVEEADDGVQNGDRETPTATTNGNGGPDELDRLALAAGQAVSKFLRRDEAVMCQLLDPIEKHAPTLRAATPQGALFHLLLAAADLGCLIGTTNWPEDALREVHERVEGCIVSAIDVFERECGLRREDFGGEYFARRSYVPEVWKTGPDDLAPDGGRR